jgi:hypothetical protein
MPSVRPRRKPRWLGIAPRLPQRAASTLVRSHSTFSPAPSRRDEGRSLVPALTSLAADGPRRGAISAGARSAAARG